MSKSVSYFIERAGECIKMALNAPKSKQSELLRLANEWLVLGHEASGFNVQNDWEQTHKHKFN